MRSDQEAESDFRTMLIVMGSFIVFFLGLILLWDWELEADRKQQALLKELGVTNDTGQTVSVWARRGIDPPSSGVPISIFRPAECSPPECGIQHGITRSWTFDQKSDSAYPPFLVTAWSNETGIILYSNEFSIEEIEAADWQLTISDQR